MPAWSEFHTEGAATLKLREAKVVRTRGTDNRLVLEERRERAGMRNTVTLQRAEVSRLRGVESYKANMWLKNKLKPGSSRELIPTLPLEQTMSVSDLSNQRS